MVTYGDCSTVEWCIESTVLIVKDLSDVKWCEVSCDGS